MARQLKLRWLGLSFLALLLIGTVVYHYLLDITLLEALYMTVITISTVGYKEVGVLNHEAMIFSIFFIMVGVTLGGYLFSTIVVILVEGGLSNFWRKQRMERTIDNLKQHYIICGAGETGEVVIEEFKKRGTPYVVIENDLEVCRLLTLEKIPVIHGDATEEIHLKRAGIDKAKGLISVISSDATNVYTVLTARQMNPDLFIISRAIDRHAPSKLIKAGANKTISATDIGGKRMATLALRPAVVSFLDVMTLLGDIELDLEDVQIHIGSEMIEKTLAQLKIPEKIGLIVIGIQKCDTDNTQFNPGSETLIELSDRLMVLGTPEQVTALRIMAKDTRND